MLDTSGSLVGISRDGPAVLTLDDTARGRGQGPRLNVGEVLADVVLPIRRWSSPRRVTGSFVGAASCTLTCLRGRVFRSRPPHAASAAFTGRGRVACESLTDAQTASRAPSRPIVARTHRRLRHPDRGSDLLSLGPGRRHLFASPTRPVRARHSGPVELGAAINGHPLEPLTVDLTDPFTAVFVGRAHPPDGRPTPTSWRSASAASVRGCASESRSQLRRRSRRRHPRAPGRRRLRRPVRGEGEPRGHHHGRPPETAEHGLRFTSATAPSTRRWSSARRRAGARPHDALDDARRAGRGRCASR